VNLSVPEAWVAPVALVSPLVLLLNDTNIVSYANRAKRIRK
jgi:hypothetical protein